MTIKKKINDYFEFADKNMHPISRIILKVLNFMIFITFLIAGSYLIYYKQTQLGFDIYVILSIYMIFTKLEKLE